MINKTKFSPIAERKYNQIIWDQNKKLKKIEREKKKIIEDWIDN